MEDRFFKFSIFSRYPNLIHGMSLRSSGDMRFGPQQPKDTIANRQSFFDELKIDGGSVVNASQVHGHAVAVVGRADAGKGVKNQDTAIANTDGLVTAEKGIHLMIKVADCLPVFIFDPTREIVGLVHAGWRGILGGIVSESIQKMVSLGSRPEDLVVGIGPGICQKHFTVKNDVLVHFKDAYPKATMVRNKDGYVDLRRAVLDDLVKSQVPKENIEVSHLCTFCESGLFGSFRRDGKGALEMAAIIGVD